MARCGRRRIDYVRTLTAPNWKAKDEDVVMDVKGHSTITVHDPQMFTKSPGTA